MGFEQRKQERQALMQHLTLAKRSLICLMRIKLRIILKPVSLFALCA